MGNLKDKVALVKAAPLGVGSTIYDRISHQRDEIARALPRHMDADRFTRIVLTQVRRTPKLLACSQASLLGSVMLLAQVGLEPDGRNAHLVPYGTDAQAIIDYRGYIELARRSGLVTDIYAEVVCANDEFHYELGLHRDLRHVPAEGDRGELVKVYAVANFTGGGYAFVVLTDTDVAKRRARSKSASGSTSPWKTDPEAMWRKSAIRALSPYLPYSPELVRAEALDRAVDSGTVPSDLDFIDIELVEEPAETLAAVPDPEDAA
jgi:recombination protein RecT